MGTYNPGIPQATFAAIGGDVHGLISKRIAEDGVRVTELTFAAGARWGERPQGPRRDRAVRASARRGRDQRHAHRADGQ
jgi:hypothetical protein